MAARRGTVTLSRRYSGKTPVRAARRGIVVRARRLITLALLFSTMLAAFGCEAAPSGSSVEAEPIKNYRDIPGVTDEEIEAIESLKSRRSSFSYGSILTSDAFLLPDGTPAGFSSLFCGLLTELFDIPFVMEIHPWDSIIDGLADRSIDFSGDLTPASGRREGFFMTAPISQRTLSAFFLNGAGDIRSAADLNGLKLGFIRGSTTASLIRTSYPSLDFEPVEVRSREDVARMLTSGRIDVYVSESVTSISYLGDGLIADVGVLSLVFNPVSMSTANPELEAVIAVVDKYLEAGGVGHTHLLRRQGAREYAAYRLQRGLTDRQAGYIDRLIESSGTVPVAFEHDNYPISFWNEADGEFQGIAADVLDEISLLTGIEFRVVSSKDTQAPQILEMLENGDASMVSELMQTSERAGKFLWPHNSYHTSYSAFLSKADYQDLEFYQIPLSAVGIVSGTSFVELFDKWFPEGAGKHLYNSVDEALDALESGEIDLYLTSDHILLYQTHYREKPGYKINLLLDETPIESHFGFNLDEAVLCSIIDQAQGLIDTGRIGMDWTGRVYDYSRRVAEERAANLTFFLIVIGLLMIPLFILFWKNNQTRAMYKHQLVTRSTIMDELMRTSGELEGALKVKNEFLAKMNHEIRTPMNAIIGMTELALREDLPGVARDHVITVKQAGANLQSIINDLLDVSNIESGDLKIDAGEYSLSSLVNDVVNIIRMRVVDTRLRFAVNLDSNLPDLLIGDEARIRQVLINVLGNAVKYTDKGYIYLKVNGELVKGDSVPAGENAPAGDCVPAGEGVPAGENVLAGDSAPAGENVLAGEGEPAPESAVRLKFEIEDSGRGIRPESIDMLFSHYYQGDDDPGDDEGRIGLGLPITKSLLSAMNGNITVESELGKGSLFTITLPQGLSGLVKVAAVENPDKISVLVFERRGVSAASAVYAIRNLGAKCELASGKDDFFGKIASGSYSFVFISYFLFGECKDDLRKYSDKVKVVLLAEFGQAIPGEDLHVLPMPIYAISVANLFNGITDSYSYSSGAETVARFTAPDARVLVVDDIQTNLKVISGLMAPYGMNVDLCLSGADAVKAVISSGYDLVLMDHRMPETDGVEATMEIRALGETYPHLKNLPIIALTATAVTGMKEMFLANGFDDFLPKPIDTVKLNGIMGKWLPKDKQKSPARDVADASAGEAFYAGAVVEVDGLDAGKGFRMSGGDADQYHETLELYCEDALTRIDKLNQCLEKNDIELYITYIHALKSASANVGADKLASEAYDLEMAGLRRDMFFVTSYNERFINGLKAMIAGIRGALSAFAATCADTGAAIDSGQFIAELRILKCALDDMAAGAIDRSLAGLSDLARTGGERAAVKRLSKHVLMGEYGEAIALAEELLAE